MQNKLLPCPFCGGEAIKSAFSWGAITDEYTIQCTMCGSRTKVLKLEEAIKTWNTRKPMERIVEQLEEQIDNNRGWEDEDYYWGETKGYEHAIEIVKGGVDNAG